MSNTAILAVCGVAILPAQIPQAGSLFDAVRQDA